MLTFKIIPYNSVPWEQLDRFEDRVIFQTRAWVDYLAETQGARPVLAEIRSGPTLAGYFTGLTVGRLGIKILGSSFPGWTTPYMGFNLMPGFTRAEILPAFTQWAHNDLGCLHFEISDRRFRDEDAGQLGFEISAYESYKTDLAQTEDEIFGKMDSACRRCIRKAEKSGVIIEEASDDAFAEEYHAQLTDVFAKQQRVPSYTVNRVRSLIKHIRPTGNLLLLRARRPDGLCIGTGIYPGMNEVAFFWGNASWREHQNWRPNESLHWYAMRYWKTRGVQTFDWGGGGDYKEKYGVEPLRASWFIHSRFKALGKMRHQARAMYYSAQRFIGVLKRRS
jgi:hypothetical protein